MKHLLFFGLFMITFAFECYTCNNKKGDDDGQPCVEKKEICESEVDSCSMVTYFSHFDKKVHTRKFCTTKGTPIYQYLLFFPGSSLCQNIKTANLMNPPRTAPRTAPRAKRDVVLPPAPPIRQSSSLLCVCTTSLCNKGSYKEVMERNMMDNLELLNQEEKDVKGNDALEEELFAR